MTPKNISSPQKSWQVNPKLILVGLSIGVVVIVAASFVVRSTNSPTLRGLGVIQFLNVENEGNLPTAFSVALLTFAAILLYIIGLLNRANSALFSKQWLWLGILFSYLAVDELAGIHELFNSVGLLLQRLGWGGVYQGYFRWPWVLVGIFAVIAVYFVFWRFVRSLPKRTGRYFFFAATLFVAGAIGLEMVGGWLSPVLDGPGSGAMPITYLLVSHAEEALEMTGVVVFIYALLEYGHPIIVSLDETPKRIGVSIGC